MSEKIVVFKAQTDKIETVDYIGYESLSESVNGLIEHFDTKQFKDLKLDFWCNDEFTYSDDPDCQYVNTIASFMSEQTIYGNVVVSVSLPEGASRGFSPKELKDFMDFIQTSIENEDFKAASKTFHEKADHKRPEPKARVYNFDIEKVDKDNLSMFYNLPLGNLYWKGNNGYEVAMDYSEEEILQYISKDNNKVYFISGSEKSSDEVSKLIERYEKEQKDMKKLTNELEKG